MSKEEFPVYEHEINDELSEYENEDMEMDDVAELRSSAVGIRTSAWRTHPRQTPISISTSTGSRTESQRVATPAPFAVSTCSVFSPKESRVSSQAPPSPAQLLKRRLQSKKKSLNQEFASRLRRLRLPILPLFPMPNGAPHPSLPKTLLQFHLLTEPELDAIAAYYHQITPTNVHRFSYPACMNWDSLFLTNPESEPGLTGEERACCLLIEERVAIKRRMIGKFLGIGGCLTMENEVARRLKFYEDWFAVSVRRAERIKEEREKKDIYWRGGWGA